MALDSRYLPSFLAAVRCGSIGRAAAETGMTQAGLSRVIKKLESQLGVALLERHTTGVTPTVFGDALLPHAREIVAAAEAAFDEIMALRGLSAGIVRVGAVASVASGRIPSAIQALLRKWPNLQVRVLEGTEDQLAEALAKREIDLAIGGRMEHHEVKFTRPDMLTDVVNVICRCGHPLAKKSPLRIADVLPYQWVLSPKQILPMIEFRSRFIAAGLEPPEATVETRSVSTIRALVAATDMLAWQPHALIALSSSAHVQELAVEGLVWERNYFVFRRQRGVMPPAALKFIDEIKGLPRRT